MSDLLKEAIADAKAVRETALENAKIALQEAFAPQLKSMLSAKLAEDDVEEGYDDKMSREEDDDEMEEGGYGKSYREDDDDEMDVDEMDHGDMEREDDDEEMEMDEEEIIEIDGVKYAPVVSEEEHEEDEEMEEGEHEDEEEMDEDRNLDLEAVIKELEAEISEAEESDEDLAEGAHEDDEDKKKDESVDEEVVTEEDDEDEDKDDMDEQSKSSGIGAGDNKVAQASASDEEDPGKGKMHESIEYLQSELNEYKEAVTFLREKLHEVNILNAKLLYTNKLFKEFALTNEQKLKIVETFDRAQTTREIKLVYSTLAESMKKESVEVKSHAVQEAASRKTGSTKPTSKKIITEESEVASRFKKLAGILKN